MRVDNLAEVWPSIIVTVIYCFVKVRGEYIVLINNRSSIYRRRRECSPLY